ncbi:MAG: TlpA family protein disulfide reductase [Actinomycetota bacterium]|nr:TlpA family protein disulfide reductase [Actinomycetota bacterium]
MTGRRAPIIAGIVGVAVMALVLLFAVSPGGGERETTSPLLGKLAPALIGPTISGEDFDLDDHRGQWVLVNFFATWCGPCIVEHPELIEFSESHPGEVQVVSVVYNESVEKVEQFFAEKGGDWPVMTQGQSASLEYGVKKLPESFLVNPSGTVVVKINGGVKAADLDELLAEQDAAARAGGEGS